MSGLQKKVNKKTDSTLETIDHQKIRRRKFRSRKFRQRKFRRQKIFRQNFVPISNSETLFLKLVISIGN